MAPHAGQLLCVLAMSKPHSWQKRPPWEGVWQFGQAKLPSEPPLRCCPAAFDAVEAKAGGSSKHSSQTQFWHESQQW